MPGFDERSFDERYHLSYLTLRQAIGWLALLMPFSVRLGAYWFEGIHSTGSISAYYYTGMRDVFVGTMVLVGVLLACYRTPEKLDTWIGLIVGLSAAGIGLFPMDPTFAQEIVQRHPDVVSDRCYLNRGLLGYHFLFVGTFLLFGFWLVYFRFRALTPADPKLEKRQRNRIYQICGLIMLVGSAIIGVLVLFAKQASIFWPETVVVVAFAAAWLVKGQRFFPDRDPPS